MSIGVMTSVALGGAFGAVLRYILGIFVSFPFGTLSVNLIGSFLMGAFYSMLADKIASPFSAFIMVGCLGGFTTFSSFSLDVLRLIENRDLGLAFLYIGVSVFGAISLCFLGYFLYGLWHGR